MRATLMSLTLATGLSLPAAALACSCGPIPDAAIARDAARAVFEGKVTAGPIGGDEKADNGIQSAMAQVTYQFDVLRRWKGVPGAEATVRTSRSSSACGRSFKVGQSYLVYAVGDSDGTLVDTMCTRTRQLADAGEDLVALGDPGAAPEPGDQAPAEAPADPDAEAPAQDAPAAREVAAEATPAQDAPPPAAVVAEESTPAKRSKRKKAAAEDDDDLSKGCSQAAGAAPDAVLLLALLPWVRRRP